MPTMQGTDLPAAEPIEDLIAQLATSQNGTAIMARSPTFDWLTTGTYTFPMPSVKGKKIHIKGSRPVITAKTGTAAGQLLQQLATSKNPPSIMGVTPVFDWLSTSTATINLPQIPNKNVLIQVSRFVLTSKTGVATGTMAYQIGNDAGVSNVTGLNATTPFTLTAASVNTAWTATPNSNTGASNGMLVNLNAGPLKVKIITPFGGATVLQGYFEVSVWYVD